MKEKGAGRHPMIRVVFNGASELITVSLTSPHALYPILGDVKRALRKLGAIKSNGPGERRRRKRKQRGPLTLTTYRREPHTSAADFLRSITRLEIPQRRGRGMNLHALRRRK